MQDDPMDWLCEAGDADMEDLVRALAQTERNDFQYNWPLWARTAQLPPEGDWRVWLVMAGRGFGKTRAGAEWVRKLAEENPDARIALVAATLNEGRAVMIEGESGVIAVSPPHRAPKYEPSLRRLTWENGAQAMLYSAGEPESLRGPQHSQAFGSGAKRGDGKRGSHSRRSALARGNRKRTGYAAICPRCGPDVAGGNIAPGGMDRACGSSRGLERRRLALYPAAAGHAYSRSLDRSFSALRRAVADFSEARPATRR
jgi:hypothetical protein